jgi:rhombotail lipoprotein
MKGKALILVLSASVALSGCALFFQRGACGSSCVRTGNSSSLVEFLYPEGTPPPTDTIPELRVPLRVGLAILPSRPGISATTLDAQQKLDLLERIRLRFSSRQFVSEIIIIPDYYLATARGYSGLAGVQRLQNLDLIALVSYDQVTRQNDNKLSLGYLTIVGAYILPGTSQDTATLVDLAVVDPVTRSLVLRAGGTSSGRGLSTLVDANRDARKASVAGFDAATTQLIENFDAALVAFETSVRAGKANVRVVKRNQSGAGGGGAVGALDVLVLLMLLAVATRRVRSSALAT